MLSASNQTISESKISLWISFFVILPVFALALFSYLKSLDYFPLAQIRITIPEGFTKEDVAGRFGPFMNFDRDNFLQLAREGYLFPDTYFFNGDEKEEEIIGRMENNFKEKVGEVEPEIVIMASLLEKELPVSGDRKIVSGILWKRLEIGMPLQVDVASDTYLSKGLPLAPICNPGLDAINAALNPIETDYLYYLSGKDGKTHFAKNFEEHKLNKAKYLR